MRAEEKISQARGGLFPKVSVLGAHSIEDSGAGSSPSDSTSARINLEQPLFQGLREFSTLRAANRNLESEEALKLQAKLNLYQSIGRVFFRVLLAERDLGTLEALRDLTEKRVGDLTSRTKIGRTRKSELLTSQTQLLLLRSQIVAAQATLKQARDDFALETGLDRNLALMNTTEVAKTLEKVDFYIAAIFARGLHKPIA